MVTKRLFGTTKNNKIVNEYIIKNDELEVSVIEYGATIKNIFYNGRDVVLGYDTLSEYEANDKYFGATVGRYANRINKGRFELNGVNYQLATNDKKNHLHGGICGFDKRVWTGKIIENGVVMSLFSKDMEENYPGNMEASVSFVVKGSSLEIEYKAISDKDTVANFTNHSYFNLDGHEITDNLLYINAKTYTPVNDELIPTGEIASVKDTPYDFTAPKKIGRDIKEIGLYDNNFCLDGSYAAKLSCQDIYLEVYTDMPGIQLYTGNYENYKVKNNKVINGYQSVCLETQYYPDSVNNKNFPSPFIKKDTEWKSKTVYKFGK